MLVFNGETGGELFTDTDFYLDVWWRGRNGNGAFMLAIAQLVLRSQAGAKARLRLCHILEPGEDAAQSEAEMRAFLNGERIKGEVAISEAKVDPLGRIAIVSGQSPVVFVGLRRPFLDETDEAYGKYLADLRVRVNLPNAIFACAADGIIFKEMFR